MRNNSDTLKTIITKKIDIAIDKMIDLQNMGLGNATISHILENLNSLYGQITN